MDRIFEEFNSLSVVFRRPASSFVKARSTSATSKLPAVIEAKLSPDSLPLLLLVASRCFLAQALVALRPVRSSRGQPWRWI